ncbi:prepilin-type N-terminal cleavage/methylation domain-containing protein [bacterium]|jgi:prepilin-type N-terminal cleavage/methylation domain-containing protein|nr:prepilin-type N-terminal cleavage/methylation domain-containing protein [bacterium]
MTLRKAFTLIELLVVIAIIGILSGLIVVSMSGVTEKANIAKAQVYYNSMRNALLGDLVSEWKFEEGSGANAYDSWSGGGASTGAANGTITGATYLSSTSGSCLYGSCLNFSGTAQYVSVPHANVPVFTTKLSAMAWVKGASAADKAIIGQLDTNAQRSWMIYNATGKLRVTVSCDGTLTNYKTSVSTTINAFDSKWHLVGFVFNAGTLTPYIDGVAIAVTPTTAGTCTSLFDSSAALTMGADLVSGTYSNLYTGILDDARVFKEIVPTAQIKEMYYSGINDLFATGKMSAEEYSQKISELSLNK